jgi:uncharacterized protein YjdB
MKTFTALTLILSAAVLSAGCSGGGDAVGPDDPGEQNIRVSGASLSKDELTIAVGSTATLTPTLSPSDATNKGVTWGSDNNAVATVDGNGKVTGVKLGRATILVSTNDGNITAACRVTVAAGIVAVTDVKLDMTTMTLASEDQIPLTATVIPATATDKSVKWSSSDRSVATVDADGRVTGVKIGGTADIVCTSGDGDKTAVCKVTVTAPDPENLLRTTYIPDPVFLDHCRKQMGEWDTNGDGKLYKNEASGVKILDVANVYGNSIHSLQGIEYFTGLTYLDCSLNNLVSLDVSKCEMLTELNCNNNSRLSSLELSAYTRMTRLNCSACSLASLDVSRCSRLLELSCFLNDLTRLDLSRCTRLVTLDVEGNELTSLDLSTNRSLKGLICNNNSLDELDLSACPELASLDCDNNSLTGLDLSKNGALIFLSCDTNLITTIDVANNSELESLVCNNNELVSMKIGAENGMLRQILSQGNRLSAEALNTILESLPPNSGSISIRNNPGAYSCDRLIAEEKNWTVLYE